MEVSRGHVLQQYVARQVAIWVHFIYQSFTVCHSLHHHHRLLYQHNNQTQASSYGKIRIHDNRANTGGGCQEQEDAQDADIHGGHLRHLLVPYQTNSDDKHISQITLLEALLTHLIHRTRDCHVFHLLQPFPLRLDEPILQNRIYKTLFMCLQSQAH